MDGFGFFSKDVALKLDINASTLRQWSLSMEKEGYEFQRNDKDQRIYYDRDINVLFELKNLIEKTRNRDDAIKQVVSRYNAVNNAEKMLGVHENERDKITASNEDINEMKEAINQQNSLIQELVKKLDQQHSYYEKKFEALEHDRNLVHSLRSSMEQRKLESADKEDKAKEQLKNIETELLEIKKNQTNSTDITVLSNQFAELSQQIQQIASAQEEKKKGFFARLFGK